MRWTKIDQIYGPALKQTDVFDPKTEDGPRRYLILQKRIVEHVYLELIQNIRVLSKYYSRMTFKRLSQLLDLPMDEAESHLSALVVNKTIYARIDRVSGIVSFVAPKDANTVLNEWSHNINSLLDIIVKTTHLIAKEEMVHSITKVISE
jgi:26S proteasome regulatory subunit N5